MRPFCGQLPHMASVARSQAVSSNALIRSTAAGEKRSKGPDSDKAPSSIWFGRTGLDHASLIGAGGVRLRTFAAVDFLSVRAMSQPLAGTPFGSARS